MVRLRSGRTAFADTPGVAGSLTTQLDEEIKHPRSNRDSKVKVYYLCIATVFCYDQSLSCSGRRMLIVEH